MPASVSASLSFLMLLLCTAGCDASDPLLGCGPGPLIFDNHGDVQGEDDGGACARVERAPTPPPENSICKACPYDLHRIVAVRGDERFDIADTAALTYEPSHHNWLDVARADLDDGRVLEVTLRYLIEGSLSDPASWSLDGALRDDDGEILDEWSMKLLGGGL